MIQRLLIAIAGAVAAFVQHGAALAAEEGKGGMPQFDPTQWPPQIVWLAITFVVLYVLMSRVAIPRITEVIEERERRINDNLRRAEHLKQDAEDAMAAYEKMMAEARAAAQQVVRQARERIAEEAAQRNAELSERLSAEIAAGEARIAEAKAKAIAGVRDVAVDLAATASARLLGGRVEKKRIAPAVDSVLKEVS